MRVGVNRTDEGMLLDAECHGETAAEMRLVGTLRAYEQDRQDDDAPVTMESAATR